MKTVRKREKPIKSWFGGIFAVPIACLKNERTTMIRVKHVQRIRIAGARVKIVNIPTSCNEFVRSAPVPKFTETPGRFTFPVCAQISAGIQKPNNVRRKRPILFNSLSSIY